MSCYLLNNYSLSTCEVFQSLFVSEYGLRHLEAANAKEEYRWGHRMIALIELCPLMGLLVSIIEAIVSKCFKQDQKVEIPQKREWVFKGSQRDSNGPVDMMVAEAIRDELEAISPEGIQ